MTQPLALIIDDEPDIRELLELTLSRMGVATRAAPDLANAYELLKQYRFDLCLADMRLPDGDGLELVKFIGRNHPELPVAVITAHGNMETAIEALKAGAFDFVSKPVDLPILRNLVDTALRASRSAADMDAVAENSELRLLGVSQAMQAIRAMIHKLGRSQAPVFISGESGTGKELAARLIHESSPRNDAPFIAVNCGAIPRELMESELFGHVKGAFTGAIRDNQGLFSAASGGTLFLDEIADLPLSMQVKLLRVIQEKLYRPVGGTEEMHTNVRIISATHKNLPELVQSGEFRQDLYFRINVIELRMPPLRERQEDLPQLITHILKEISRNYDAATPKLTLAAEHALANHSYPGNVRELENILERAFALCDSGQVDESDLGLALHKLPKEDSAELTIPGPDEGLEEFLARIETDQIQKALAEANGNRNKAAEILGLNPRALRYRIQKLGL